MIFWLLLEWGAREGDDGDDGPRCYSFQTVVHSRLLHILIYASLLAFFGYGLYMMVESNKTKLNFSFFSSLSRHCSVSAICNNNKLRYCCCCCFGFHNNGKINSTHSLVRARCYPTPMECHPTPSTTLNSSLCRRLEQTQTLCYSYTIIRNRAEEKEKSSSWKLKKKKILKKSENKQTIFVVAQLLGEQPTCVRASVCSELNDERILKKLQCKSEPERVEHS